MIELDETLSNQYSGKRALTQKMETILKTVRTDIPYYKSGLENSLFTYESPTEAIRRALSQFNPKVEISGDGSSHVVVADVDINVTRLLEEDEQ